MGGVGAGLGAIGYRVLVMGEGEAPPLDDEGWPDEVTLVGYGRGGPVATAFAVARPERVKRLILIAAEGIESPVVAVVQIRPSRLRALPWLGSWLAARREAARPVVPALPEPPQEAEHRALKRDGVPVIALWAGRDQVVPLRAMGTLAAWNRSTKQEVIEGAGHDLLETHAEAVVAALRDVLREEWAV